MVGFQLADVDESVVVAVVVVEANPCPGFHSLALVDNCPIDSANSSMMLS